MTMRPSRQAGHMGDGLLLDSSLGSDMGSAATGSGANPVPSSSWHGLNRDGEEVLRCDVNV